MNFLNNPLRLFLLVLILASCNDEQGSKKDQENPSESKKSVRDTQSITGINYQVVESPKTDSHSIRLFDIVELKLRIYTNNLELVNTYANKSIYYYYTDTPQFNSDLSAFLIGLNSGDSISYRLTAQELYHGNVTSPLKPEDTVYVGSRILGFYNERELIDKKPAEYKLKFSQKGNAVYSVVKSGKGKSIESGDSVQLNYVGTLIQNGKEFNNTYEYERPFSFRMGKQSLINAWKEILPGLREGDSLILMTHSLDAFGYGGNPPAIPPYSPLHFKIKVEKVIP